MMTNEQIDIAFTGTNFGTKDYRALLHEAVKKTAVGDHNGSTIARIIMGFGFVELKPNARGSLSELKLTPKGLDFILNESTQGKSAPKNAVTEAQASQGD